MERGNVGSAIDRMRRAVEAMRVVPRLPEGHLADVSEETESETPEALAIDSELSARALYIVYASAEGKVSKRRITVHQTIGKPPVSILAFCHERRAPRHFRLDRVLEAIDPETGEILPVIELGAILAREFDPVDPALRRAIKVLVFLGRCDGNMHPAEWEAIDKALGGYLLRFGGEDDDHGRACAMARQIAPDGNDLLIALRSFHAGKQRGELARWLDQSIGALIDADGTQHSAEFEWVMAIRDFVDSMRWGHARR